MKNTGLLLLSLLLFSSLTKAPAQEISIHGTINPVPESLVLNRITPTATQTISSLSPDKEGKFQYTIEQGVSGFYQLWTSKQSFTILVLHPGDKVEVKLDSRDMGIPISIKGSSDTELARDIIQQGRRLKFVRDSLQQVYMSYVNTPSRDTMTTKLMMQYSENDSRFQQLVSKTIDSHPGSLSLYFYTEYLDKNNDMELLEKILNSLLTKHSSDAFVKNLKAQVDVSKITAIGNIAPEIKLPTPGGDSLALSSFRGKYVLIDFWAGWCGPCRRENPKLLKVYRKYHDAGFEIYAVSLDKDRNVWLSAIANDSINWHHVSDLQYWSSVASRAYGVSSIPASFLIGPDGRIIAKGLRSEALEMHLKDIYGER